jgi:hypothetical protein
MSNATIETHDLRVSDEAFSHSAYFFPHSGSSEGCEVFNEAEPMQS